MLTLQKQEKKRSARRLGAGLEKYYLKQLSQVRFGGDFKTVDMAHTEKSYDSAENMRC